MSTTTRSFGFLLLLAAVGAGPRLEWNETGQETVAGPSSSATVAIYSFENMTSRPITISRVRTSCGCTVATLDKTVYQPGERGEIRVEFRFGDRVGRGAKRITVETDDGAGPTVLTLTVDIPEVVRLTPGALRWDLPAPPPPGDDSASPLPTFSPLAGRSGPTKSGR